MRWLVLAAALALGGCAGGFGHDAGKERWEVQNVLPADYKADLLAFMRSYLNDPTNIRSAAVSAPQRKPVAGGERYVVCVRYDARKSGGGYAGVKEGMAIYVSGKLDRFVDSPQEMRESCKDAAYAPFPELQQLRR